MAYLLTGSILGLGFELLFYASHKTRTLPVDTDFKWEILQKPLMGTY